MKLSYVAIVLVRPINPGNVGSVARAMKNAGLKHLILVNPCDFKNDEARKMAVGDMSILEKAQVFDDLKTALKSFRWSIATTRRHRRRFREGESPREIAKKISAFPTHSKVAIVFGPEDQGLGNADLALCQSVSSIPSHSAFPSLNLAQAVMVYAYELYCASLSGSKQQMDDLAGHKELEGMFEHFEKTLFHIDYFNRGKSATLMESIRSFLNRARLSRRDVRILRGIFTTVMRRAKG